MKHIYTITAILTLTASLLISPLARAETAAPTALPAAVNQVLITEVQVGATGASDEFIELYNDGLNTVDITGWQLRFLNNGSTAMPALIAEVQAVNGEPVLLPSGEYFVFHTPSVTVDASVLNQPYASRLSDSPKVIVLYQKDLWRCEYSVQSSVAWGAPHGEGLPLTIKPYTANYPYFQRVFSPDYGYSAFQDNLTDFRMLGAIPSPLHPTLAQAATPGADNVTLGEQWPDSSVTGQASDLPNQPIGGCIPTSLPVEHVVPVEEVTPSGALDESGIVAYPALDSISDPETEGLNNEQPVPQKPNAGLRLSELLPDPESPLTDAKDEFIELYNPTNEPIALGAYSFRIGSATYRTYNLPDGETLNPKEYRSFSSGQLGFTLANAGTTVALMYIADNTVADSTSYSGAPAGTGWIKIGDSWQWTTLPTKDAGNQVAMPSQPLTKLIQKQQKLALKKTTVKKTSSAKKTTQKKVSQPKEKAPVKVAAIAPVSNKQSQDVRRPIHIAVLASVGVFALLYGAYEYRHDVANFIRKLRRNRADC